MSDTTNTADSGAGEALPAVSTPKSDAEAALQTQTAPEASAEQKAAAEKAEADRQAEEKRKNRTGQFIDRIKNENAELRRRLADLERSQPRTQQASHGQQSQQERPLSIADYDYNLDAALAAAVEQATNRAEQRFTTVAQQQAAAAREQETFAAYEQRVASFADAHPDFDEVVGAIDPQFLPPQLQAAIMAHPKGPEIAYHIGTDDEALWNLASIRVDLLPAAVQRLAARLSAAPAATQTPAPPPPAPTQQVTKAPPPPPMVGGRSPTETPATKLTDDEWYAKDRERRRKR